MNADIQIPKSLNELPETDEVKNGFFPALELEGCLIDMDAEIEAPPTVLEIGGSPSMTAGNISTLIGKAKSRKSFFLVSLLSSLSSGRLILGQMQGLLPVDSTILWFDTEMSEFHITRMAKRLKNLAELHPPYNIQIYGLRKYSPAQRVEIIEHAIYNTDKLGFVAIDGLRDLLTRGINDEEEATTITSNLLRWSAEKNVHITTVLHQNKNDLNARGHVGTEVVNKSESVISISKDTENEFISIVSAEFTRDMDFPDFAFTIDANGLPVEADIPEKMTQTDKRLIRIQTVMDTVLNMKRLSHTELKNEYMCTTGKSLSTAKRDIDTAIESGYIKLHDGKYLLSKHEF